MEETKKYIIMCYSVGEGFFTIMDLTIKELMNWCEYFNFHKCHESWDSDSYYIWEFNERNLKFAMIEVGEVKDDYERDYEPEDLIKKYAY